MTKTQTDSQPLWNNQILKFWFSKLNLLYSRTWQFWSSWSKDWFFVYLSKLDLRDFTVIVASTQTTRLVIQYISPDLQALFTEVGFSRRMKIYTASFSSEISFISKGLDTADIYLIRWYVTFHMDFFSTQRF